GRARLATARSAAGPLVATHGAAGAVGLTGPGASRVVEPVAGLVRLVHHVVTASRGRRAGTVGPAATGTGRIVGPVPGLARLVHHVVPTYGQRGTGAVRLAAPGAGGIVRSVTRFVRLIHHVVATDGQGGTGTVRPATPRTARIVCPVAGFGRLIHHVVPARRRRGTGAIGLAAPGAGIVRPPVALLARLVHHVVAADRRGGASAVRPAAAGARAVRRPVALLARLVHHVVAAGRRRGARAVRPAPPGAGAVRRPVAVLARLVQLAVAAEGYDGRQDREQHLRFADGCFLRVVLDVVQRRSIERKAVDAVATDGRGHIEVHSLVQQDGSRLTEERTVDRRLGLPRHRELVPAAARDGVESATRVAARARALAHDQTQVRGADVPASDAADANPEERAIGGARIHLEHRALAVVGGRLGRAHRGVRLDHGHRRPTCAVGLAEARAGAAVGPVALLTRLVDDVVAAARRRRTGTVTATPPRTCRAGGPVALLARLVHEVIAAAGGRRARAVGAAPAGAGGAGSAVALLGGLVHPVVPAPRGWSDHEVQQRTLACSVFAGGIGAGRRFEAADRQRVDATSRAQRAGHVHGIASPREHRSQRCRWPCEVGDVRRAV